MRLFWNPYALYSQSKAMGSMARAYVGTSGWIYKHWKDNWYKDVRPKDYLRHMTERVNALEANGTFYREPKKETFESWCLATPEDFAFTIKGHRYLTQRKKLKDVTESVKRQREVALGLGRKLRCVVWQLPGGFSANVPRLEQFLEDLKQWPETRHSIEFRHTTWFTDEVAGLLTAHGVANCISDASKWPMWQAVTTDLVYVRLHGYEYTYATNYTEADLQWWANKTRGWLGEGREVHIYFDNDWHGYAPVNAVRMIEILGLEAPR